MSVVSFLQSTKGKLALAIIIWFLSLLGMGTGNLGSPNLWFDEALQVWAALGQGHYTNYDTPLDNSIHSVIKANYSSTWDPPGLSLLMHFLSRIDKQLWIFRSLTMLFTFASALFLTLLAVHWAPKYFLSYISGLILLLSGLLCHYSFEIRPYSMELLHAVLVVYITCRFSPCWSWKKTVLYGSLLALCMASRYCSVFPALICAALLFIKCFYEPENPNAFVFPRKKIISYLLLFLPSLLVGLALCYGLLQMKNQQWADATRNDAYHLLFLFANDPGEIINWTTLVLWLPMLTLLALRLLPLKLFPELARKYDWFVVFVLLLNLFRLLIDWAQHLPYSLTFRFNLPCHALLLFSYIPLALLVFEYCSLKYKNRTLPDRLQNLCNVALTCMVIARTFTFVRIEEDQSIGYLRRLPMDPAPKVLAIVATYPALRYAFEYGALKDRIHWRDKLYYCADKYPKQKDWTVTQKFDFIAPRSSGMSDEYYQMAKNKNYDYILESDIQMRGAGQRWGRSIVIVKLN